MYHNHTLYFPTESVILWSFLLDNTVYFRWDSSVGYFFHCMKRIYFGHYTACMLCSLIVGAFSRGWEGVRKKHCSSSWNTWFALNSWICKRTVKVLTVGKNLLKNLVIVQYLELCSSADVVIVYLTIIPFILPGPKLLPRLRERSGPSQAWRWGWITPQLSWSFL